MPPYRRRNSAANRPPRPPPGTLRTFYRPSPPLVHPATRTPAGGPILGCQLGYNDCRHPLQ